MAYRLNWSARALDDLDEIVAFVEKDSPRYAKAMVQRCFDKADSLIYDARQGRRVPEYDGEREIREVFVHSWRLIYEVGSEELRLLAIVHSARLLENTKPL